MGWFSKKEEKKDQRQPPLPLLKTEFPRYESTISHHDFDAIKQTLSPQDMPPLKRPPLLHQMGPPMPIPIKRPEGTWKPSPQERIPFEKPDLKPQEPNFTTPLMAKSMPEAPIKQGKSMFIKVDQYEDALQKLELISISIQTAEETLARIEELRSQEAHELVGWKQKLENIKAQLRSIDTTILGRS